jgi:formate-dependent nitrite reductase membrane component NrfD
VTVLPKAADERSYYGRPILKPHQWKPTIPLYFWLGGTAGVAAVHSAIERVRGNDALAGVQRNVAFAGAMIAPALLISDLGVPSRFYNMLRVFKTSSPMSVGSWILAAFGGMTAGSVFFDVVGIAPPARACDAGAALLGPPLATYTAVLISNTATPVWHEAHAALPFVFVASGIAGAGAMGATFAPHASAGSARRMMIAGALGMAAAARTMETSVGSFLAEPYRKGNAAAFKAASLSLGLAGAALGLLGRNSKGATTVAAALVATSGICERFAILAAGKQSAQDPKYTVEPQRKRLDERGRTRVSV